MSWFREQGWEVHYASAGEEPFPEGACDKVFQVCLNRSPYSMDNVRAYKMLKKILEKEDYDLIHCHTPMGGVVTRFAAHRARCRAKVIYTAHGFHFYKKAPLLNWLLYYPMEKYLARYTDCLVTINQEDFDLAVRKHFRAGRIERIYGVGVNLQRFQPVDDQQKLSLRRQYGFEADSFLLIYAAELNKNKNQAFLIRCAAKLRAQIPHIRLLLCGYGSMQEEYERIIKEQNLGECVQLLGYRKDVKELFQLSDLCVASSIREGLGLSVIEAMACGLVTVACENRGHREIIQDGKNGRLVPQGDEAQFADAVFQLYSHPEKRREMAAFQMKTIQKYDLCQVLDQMSVIYRAMMDKTKSGR